jgi:hypothetical protein
VPIELYVLQHCPFSGLLGWDFMTQHSASIDGAAMTISFEFDCETVTESLDIAEHDAISAAAHVELKPHETRISASMSSMEPTPARK